MRRSMAALVISFMGVFVPLRVVKAWTWTSSSRPTDWDAYLDGAAHWLAGTTPYACTGHHGWWLPYLAPPYIAPALSPFVGLPPTLSYVALVVLPAAAIVAHVVVTAKWGWHLAALVGAGMAVGVVFMQITPLLFACCLPYAVGRRGWLAWSLLALAVVIKPTLVAPAGCLVLATIKREDAPALADTMGLSVVLVVILRLAGLLETTEWFQQVEAWREHVEITGSFVHHMQFGTLRWADGHHELLVVVGWAVAILLNVAGRTPALAWAIGMATMPWLLGYDLVGLGVVVAVLLVGRER